MTMELPKVPMAPVNSIEIPIGDEWRYQLKWDGVRTLARLDGKGGVELFSKRVETKNSVYPEIIAILQQLRVGACVMDGEICHFDGARPNFQRVRLGVPKQKRDDALIYVVFDLLYDGGIDIRHLPFAERFERLQRLLPEPHPRLLVADIFDDGQALWEWAEQHEWEGIVSKRIDCPYVEGKTHKYWYKKRKELRLTVEVVGLQIKSGYVASLILRYNGRYVGHVSSGLTNDTKRILMEFALQNRGDSPFNSKPQPDVIWLKSPFVAKVSALEFTDSGRLRHPKLIGFGE